MYIYINKVRVAWPQIYQPMSELVEQYVYTASFWLVIVT